MQISLKGFMWLNAIIVVLITLMAYLGAWSLNQSEQRIDQVDNNIHQWKDAYKKNQSSHGKEALARAYGIEVISQLEVQEKLAKVLEDISDSDSAVYLDVFKEGAEREIIISANVILEDGRMGYIFYDPGNAGADDIEIYEEGSKWAGVLLLATCVNLLLVLVIFFFAKRQSSNISEIIDWANDLDSEGLGDVPTSNFTELSLLGSQLKSAFSRLSDANQRESNFLRFSSHELRTPIAVAQVHSEVLEEKTSKDPELSKSVVHLKKSLHDMTLITEALLWLGREDKQGIVEQRIPAAEFLESMVQEFKRVYGRSQLTTIVDVPDSLCFQAPEALIKIAVGNLLSNAFKYTEVGGVSIAMSGDNLVIEDSGQGLGSKKADSHGVGLALVQQICEKCGWSVFVTDREDGGVRAVLDFGSAVSDKV